MNSFCVLCTFLIPLHCSLHWPQIVGFFTTLCLSCSLFADVMSDRCVLWRVKHTAAKLFSLQCAVFVFIVFGLVLWHLQELSCFVALLSTPSVLPLPIEQIVYWETEHDSPRNIFKRLPRWEIAGQTEHMLGNSCLKDSKMTWDKRWLNHDGLKKRFRCCMTWNYLHDCCASIRSYFIFNYKIFLRESWVAQLTIRLHWLEALFLNEDPLR